MRVGRRPLFFAALAVLCLIMLDPTPAQYRWVNLLGAGLGFFWAIMLLLEERSLVKITPPAPGETKDRARRSPMG